MSDQSKLHAASTAPTQVNSFLVPNANHNSEDSLKAHRVLVQLREKRLRLVGALWRELLSSVPSHAAWEKEEVEESGDPLNYWTGYASMCPASMPISRISARFTPSVHEAKLQAIEEMEDEIRVLTNVPKGMRPWL